jgi:hypothetical protein
MPEPAGTKPPAGEAAQPAAPERPGGQQVAAPTGGSQAGADVTTAVTDGRCWPTYLLGLALQVFLWFLLFWFLAVAIGAGQHLTEFRYVGF